MKDFLNYALQTINKEKGLMLELPRDENELSLLLKPIEKELREQWELFTAENNHINAAWKKEQAEFLATQNLVLQTLKNDKRESTELIVGYIMRNSHIWTTRHGKAPETWIYKEGIYVPHGETYIKEITRSFLGKSYSTHLGNEVMNKIQAETYIESSEFFEAQNKHKYLIPVQNGILNLKEKELLSFDHKKIFFHKLPVFYEPEADCPKIKSFFTTTLGNQEDITVLQEFFGFTLIKEYSYEKSLLLLGNGRNGKSKTLELLKHLLGSENCTSISLQDIENKNFGLSELHNKLVNISGDISSEALQGTGKFKALTGRDLVTADRKYLEQIQFENYAKMVFSANQVPPTKDLSDGFFDRWIIITYPYKFVEQSILDGDDSGLFRLKNPNIIQDILCVDELSGLLNWSIEGLHRLLSQDGFSHSLTTDEVKTFWIRKSDSFQAFCMDSLCEDISGYVKKSDLKFFYVQYCKKHKLLPRGDKNIKYVLTTKYGASDERISENGQQISSWGGVKLLDVSQDLRKDSMTSKGRDGFSPYREFQKSPIGQKTPATLTTLTNYDQEEVTIPMCEHGFYQDETCLFCKKNEEEQKYNEQ